MAIQALESFFQVTDLGVGVTEDPLRREDRARHPSRDLSEQTLYALDQFVLRGGRLIALFNPMCMADRESSMGNPMMAGMDTASNLNALTKAWGVELADGKVVGDPGLRHPAPASPRPGGQRAGGDDPRRGPGLQGRRGHRPA